jgi:hypothetical protein
VSRHTATNDKGHQFVYGFDEPLSYYFLDRVYPDGRFRHIVGLCSFPPVYGSALNLLEFLDKFRVEVPEAHRELLMLDLPI